MVTGIAFFVFLLFGLFLFWGGVQFYGTRFMLLHKKIAKAHDELKVTEELLQAKADLEKTTEDLSRQKFELESDIVRLQREQEIHDVKMRKKKAMMEKLESEIASLEEQDNANDLRVEMEELTKRKENVTAELKDLEEKVQETKAGLRTLDDKFIRERREREEKMEAEMQGQRQSLQDEVNADIARYKEIKLDETKLSVDKAKISAVRTIKEWWTAEKKRLEEVFAQELRELRAEYRIKMQDKVAKELKELRGL